MVFMAPKPPSSVKRHNTNGYQCGCGRCRHTWAAWQTGHYEPKLGDGEHGWCLDVEFGPEESVEWAWEAQA